MWVREKCTGGLTRLFSVDLLRTARPVDDTSRSIQARRRALGKVLLRLPVDTHTRGKHFTRDVELQLKTWAAKLGPTLRFLFRTLQIPYGIWFDWIS